uniref:Uncharacterized protein n=1 Tax=Nelumbo nucifera TaxID=4432 RepID=A0A822XIB0_NELNU|nr:TPA_asm: hypothetical protein HUJ06_022717 [Nelumbo nucifera]
MLCPSCHCRSSQGKENRKNEEKKKQRRTGVLFVAADESLKVSLSHRSWKDSVYG